MKANIWHNGDDAYDGWVGTCDASQNLCSEFIDETDTSVENHGAGKSYYVINNDKLANTSVVDDTQCSGNVSQKLGCVLFDNTTDTQLTSNASASYVSSIHADALSATSPNTLVAPIDCDASPTKAVFPLSNVMAKQLGKVNVDLCARRCQYSVSSLDELVSPGAQIDGSKTDERSCLVDSDCPSLTTKLGAVVKATCGDVTAGYRLRDDSNRVLKVDRDRTCAAWLACQSSRESFDPNSNKYVNICDSVNLCSQGNSVGDQTNCTSWTARAPQIFTDVLYSARDTSWAGTEFSGYTIPNELPVEQDNQFNMSSNARYCFDSKGIKMTSPDTCFDDGDCQKGSDPNATCQTAPPNYRLVHNAGSCANVCSSGKCSMTQSACSKDTDCAAPSNGDSCKVGFCSVSKTACSASSECPGTETCIIGYCQATSGTYCLSDTECGTTSNTPYCDTIQNKCVDQLLIGDISKYGCTTSSDCNKNGATNQTCVQAATMVQGSCFNKSCISDFRDTNGDGFADTLPPTDADALNAATDSTCRGYPELDSPFPYKVVTKWNLGPTSDKNPSKPLVAATSPFAAMVQSAFKDVTSTPTNIAPLNSNSLIANAYSKPHDYVTGYDGVNVCSPDPLTGKVSDTCMCTYQKVTYGSGDTRYYPVGTVPITSVCVGGLMAGSACTVDSDCKTELTPDVPAGANNSPPEVSATYSTGTCTPVSTQKTIYGWDGYCLEKDSTIQLNGTTDPNDRPCLTWLPVDHLYGATDLYAKDYSAGYENNDNTYYCAEPSVAWDVQTSGSYSTGGKTYPQT